MANRYWVGGGSSTNWNATGNTNWSATSGGANNASVPTSADDVFFDASSGSGTAVVNGASRTVASLDCTGYTGTLSCNASNELIINGLNGKCLLSSGMTLTMLSGSLIKFTANYGTHSLTTNGQIIRTLEVDGFYNTLKFEDNVELTSFLTLTAGFVDRNGKSLKCGRFISSGSTLRLFHSGKLTTQTSSTDVEGIGGGVAGVSETSQQQAQSFVANSSTILGVGVDLIKSGTPTDDLIFSIYTALGGSLLKTKSVPLASLVNGGMNFVVFDTPLTVTPTTTYFLVVSRSGARDATNFWSWYTQEFDDYYTDGASYSRDNNSWTENVGEDKSFIILEKNTTTDIELTSTGTVWDLATSTNFKCFDNDYEIRLTNNSSSTKTFAGGGLTYYDVWNNTTGTGTLTVSGSNTFNTFKVDSGRTQIFTAGTTQTIATLDASGSTIQSSSAGSPFTFSKTTGAITMQGGSLKDSTATGGASFKAVLTTNVSGNSGWNFVYQPVVTTEPVTSITFATGIGNGTVTEDYEVAVTRRGFVYSTTSHPLPGDIDPGTSDYELLNSTTGTFTGGSYTGLLTALTPEELYFVRAFAENEAGFGYGNEVSFESIDTFPNSTNVTNTNTTTTSVVNTNTTPASTTNATTQPATVVNQITNPTGIINLTTATTNVTNI